MSWAILRPSSEPLANEEEWYRQSNKKHGKTGVNHNRCDVSHTGDPIVKEFGHAVSPQILDHCRRDQNLSRYWLVAVNLWEWSVNF
jgi:hypothetical protein